MTTELPASLGALARLPRGIVDDVAEAMGLARRFVAEVVEPNHLAIDRRVSADPSYVPWEIVRAANDFGLYTTWLPRLFGGRGLSLLSLYFFLEEVSATCVGIANVVGVHYLGVTTLAATWNTRLMRRVLGEVVAGERTREPCLVSLAITEPGAGTDMEETELLARIRPGTTARRVEGGHRLDGRKVFISNGHVSTWHMVIACEDRARAADTGVVLAVRSGTPGFAFGAKEEKMGQKACVASELVFDDCFVPDELVAFQRRDATAIGVVPRTAFQLIIDSVVAATRAGVGAFGAGVARGAHRDACAFARRPGQNGVRPVDDEVVRMRLADLFANAHVARLAWVESAWANGLDGLFRGLHAPWPFALARVLPAFGFLAPLLDSRLTARALRSAMHDASARTRADRTSGLGSVAKIVGSDLAVESADLALSLVGAEGTRLGGLEKRLRDAKLLQIYEGTNQLNRLNVFKCLVGPDWSDVDPFG